MADHILTGNITGNIGIKTGNFPLAVALNKQVTGFTASNVMLGGSITGVGFTVSGEGKDYHINITFPDNIDLSSFTVNIIGSAMVDGVSESIEGVNQKTVHYDTQSTISAVFDDPEYTELEANLLIRVPVMFGDPGQTEIVGLDRTDFSLHRLLGDEIFDFDYYITGSGLSYVINIIPTIEKQGAFSLDIVGHVLKADGIENEVVLNHAVILYYDTRTPNLIDFDILPTVTPGIWDAYLEYDLDITELGVDDFEYEGSALNQPLLYYWNGSGVPDYKKDRVIGVDRASTSLSVAFNPYADIRLSSYVGINGQEIEITIKFNTPVPFNIGHLIVDNGTISNFSGSGSDYSATYTVPDSGVGTAQIKIELETIGNINNRSTTVDLNYGSDLDDIDEPHNDFNRYIDDLKDEVGDWVKVPDQINNEIPGKFFLLRYVNPDPLEEVMKGTFNIRIKKDSVKGPSGEPVDSLQQQSGIQQRSSRAVARQTQTLTVIEVYWLGSNNQGPSNFFAIDFNVGTATPSINDMTFSGEVYLDGVLQDTLNSDDVVGLFQVANGFAIRFNLPDFDYFFVRLQIDAGVIEPDSASVLPHADIDVTLTDGDGDPPDPVDPVDPLDEIIPTISIADTQIERGESTTATITFPSAHSGFALNDLSVNFGSLSSFNIVNSLTYTVNITAPLTSSGDIILTLAANALTGNTNPEVTATVSWSAPPFGDIVWIVPTSPVSPIFTSELRFDVPASAPVVNDIRMRTGAALAFQLTSQNTTITSIAGTNNYLISVDASADVTGSASYFFRLRPNTISYDGSNYPAVNFDSPEFTIDDSVGQIASFTITTTPTVVVSGVPVVFNIASNIVVNGLTNADITVVGGVAEPIQGSGSAYTVRVTPPSTGSGSITLTIAENAVDELNDETSHSVNYSPLVIPEAVMTVSITETSVVGGSFVTVNVSSNISVSGLTINDFTTTRGTLSNFQSLGGNQYSLRLTLPSTGSGNARVTLAADSVNEGNNTASDVVSYAPAVVPEAVMTVSITETSANVGDVVVVNVGSNITVSGLTIDDFTTTRGTLDNFQSLGNNMYSLDLTLPLTGSGNARVRLLADSVNEGNNAATDVVAYSTPTFFIEPIAEQNITLGADWALDVNITGDPDDAYVRGELAGFGWDYSNGVLSIIGTPEILGSKKPFTVYARKGSSTIQRSAIYNVIPSAPVIDIFGPWTMVKGTPFSEEIIIRNNPNTVVVSGHWFFLDYETTEDGARVFGEVPADHDFTIDEGDITVVASNNGGTVSRSGDINVSDFINLDGLLFTLSSSSTLYGLAITSSEILSVNDLHTNEMMYRFNLSNGSFLGSVDAGLSWQDDDFRLTYDSQSNSIWVFYEDNSQDALLKQPSGSAINIQSNVSNFSLNIGGVCIDDNYIWCAVRYYNGSSFIHNFYRLNKSGGSKTTIPTSATFSTSILVKIGDYLYMPSGNTMLQAFSTSGARVSSEDISISSLGIQGFLRGIYYVDSDNLLYILDSSKNVYVKTIGGNVQSNTIPGAPAGLDITFNSFLGTVTYSWNAVIGDSTGGSPILRYELDVGFGTFFSVGLSLSFTEDWIGSGFSHGMRVRAVNIVGEGTSSPQYIEVAP